MFKQVLTVTSRQYTMLQKRSFASLISVQELKSNLENVKILDGSWHMPNSNRDPYDEFLKKRIAKSQFFHIDGIKDTSTDLPHMLPSPEVFANAVGKLGIDQHDHVVVYDTVGVFSACRAFGHDTVSVLNGGLPAWDGPTESGVPEKVQEKHYKVPTINTQIVRDYPTILANARKAQFNEDYIQVLDARPYARFTGQAPEPREGLSSGHMPGSISVPFNEVVGPDGKLYDDEKLKQIFQGKGVDLSKEIITSCAVYDGSWTEYAGRNDAIIIKI
ncbi:hypothetical protein RMCBS344292_05293 [Rhizopus microsporus]|nr:hypothetical protein RMCBS344292_05293 [Rhizopus microsporus]